MVHGTGQAVPDQQTLGTRVVVHGTDQAVPNQLEHRSYTRVVVHGAGKAVSDQ